LNELEDAFAREIPKKSHKLKTPIVDATLSKATPCQLLLNKYTLNDLKPHLHTAAGVEKVWQVENGHDSSLAI